MKWLTDEPPKDSQFLADVGLPYAVVCAWNGIDDGCWVHANLNIDLFHGKWIDVYFETESVGVEVKRWMHLPELEQ